MQKFIVLPVVLQVLRVQQDATTFATDLLARAQAGEFPNHYVRAVSIYDDADDTTTHVILFAPSPLEVNVLRTNSTPPTSATYSSLLASLIPRTFAAALSAASTVPLLTKNMYPELDVRAALVANWLSSNDVEPSVIPTILALASPERDVVVGIGLASDYDDIWTDLHPLLVTAAAPSTSPRFDIVY